MANSGSIANGLAIPFAIRYSLFAIRYSLFAIRYSLFAIRYSLFAIRYSLFAIRYSLFAIRYSLFAIRFSPYSPRLDVRLTHDLGPLADLGRDQLLEFLRRRAGRRDAL